MASLHAIIPFDLPSLPPHGDHVQFDGRLDNRDDLLKQLGLSAHSPVADADCVRACYRRWGPAAFGQLLGDFAFTLWDGSRQRFYAVRDAMGLRPLFYHHTRERLVVASTIRSLFEDLRTPKQLSRTAIANYLAGTPSRPGDTFFEGIKRLPAGHWLEASRDGSLSLHRFWKPEEIRPIEGRSAEWYANEFRERFFTAVRARLPQTPSKVGVHVSGGFDSASVAVAVHHLNREWQLGLQPHAFVNVATHPAADERRYVQSVRERYPMPVEQTTSEEYWGFQPSAVVHALQDEPYEGPYLSRLCAELERARDLGIKMILSGTGGDELGGSSWYLIDLFLRGRIIRSCRELRPRSARKGESALGLSRLLLTGVMKWLRRDRDRPAPPPRWGTPQLLAHRRHPLPLRVTLGPGRADLFHRLQFCWTEPILSSGAAIYNHYGVELRHPFFDRRLFEWALSTPLGQFGDDGRVKAPMRRALADLLPEPIVRRADKGNYLYYWDLGVRFKERTRIATMFERPISEELGFIDAARLRAAFERYCRGGWVNRKQLWAAITLEDWLRRRAAGGQPIG